MVRCEPAGDAAKLRGWVVKENGLEHIGVRRAAEPEQKRGPPMEGLYWLPGPRQGIEKNLIGDNFVRRSR